MSIVSDFDPDNSSTHSTTNSVIITSSKDLHKFKSIPNSSNPILYGGDSLLNLNYVERELECQICLSPLESPVLLPCNAHSLCYPCISTLFSHSKREKDGYRHIHCPSCGVTSGVIKLKKVESLKVNRELERVKTAYEKERSLWVNEKLHLEVKLNSLSSFIEEDKVEDKKKTPVKKASKKGLSKNEKETLQEMLEDFGLEKMKEASLLLMESLKAKEKEAETPKKRGRPPKAKVDEKESDDSEDEEVSGSGRKKSKGSDKKVTSSRRGIWVSVGKSKQTKGNSLKRGSTVDLEESPGKKGKAVRSLKKVKTSRF